MSGRANTRVFLLLTIGNVGAGRIVLELRDEVAPKTCENFRLLSQLQHVSGEKGKGKQGKPLHFKGSTIHRIIPGFIVQGGDIVNGNGYGGESIYSKNDKKSGEFDDESFALKHSGPGILSMANSGKNTNTSQFFITLAAAPHLDGKHVAFGQVVEGMEVLKKLEAAGTCDGMTTKHVTIMDCGMAN